MSTSSVKVSGVETVVANLGVWTKKKSAEVASVSQTVIAPKLEAYAKANRPWTDRTGNARRGLNARSTASAKEIVVTLAHAVYYGVYLEKNQGGKYAILLPTIRANKSLVKSILEDCWSK